MLSIVVAALYGGSDMRSLSRVARPSLILNCLRRNMNGDQELSWFEVIKALRKDNFNQEALFLGNEASLEAAQEQLENGEIITIACECYPKILITNLGENAPPIIWISDPILRQIQPWNNNDGSERTCIAAVGCRSPLPIGLAIAKEVGLWTAKNGYLAISGGASGCDTAFGSAAFGAGSEAVHILPHGINDIPRDMWGYAISVCRPHESFSTARAMERNSLIYSFGHMTVVCSVRYRQGGSWLGASNALKNHRAVVVADWTSTGAAQLIESQASGTYGLAQRALANLGARPIQFDIQTYKSEIGPKLDEELKFALNKAIGNIDTGLFEPENSSL
jgi:predicted Rossmann fold nucleotide-binding protein DprA/Smf involved in DNA uptake